MKILTALSLLGILVSLPVAAAAEAPGLVPLQGVLTDPEGYPIMGDTDLVFALYPSVSAEVPLWTESQKLTLQDGTFTAYLGEETLLPLQLFHENSEIWLGITVEDDPEMSRIFLGTAPFAAYAEFCGSAPVHTHAFADLDGNITPQMLPNGILFGSQTCEVGQVVVGVDQDGSLFCAEDADTTYGPNDFAASGQTCNDGETVVGISVSGLVQCETKAATSYSGADFALSDQLCPGGQAATGVGPAGALQCATDANTTYDGADFATSGQNCKANQVATGISGAGALQCSAVSGAQIQGGKVMLYLQNAVCGGGSAPTTEPTCTTGECSGGFWNGHYDCAGVCMPMQPAFTCDNTSLGYLLEP